MMDGTPVTTITGSNGGASINVNVSISKPGGGGQCGSRGQGKFYALYGSNHGAGAMMA